MPLLALADLSNVSSAAFKAKGLASNGWATKAATYTAVAGDKLLCDTSGGAFTVNLPTSPASGDEVQVADAAGSFLTHNLTIGRNGKTIKGLGADLVLNSAFGITRLIYTGSTWLY